MLKKDCGNHDDDYWSCCLISSCSINKKHCKILIALGVLILLVPLAIMIMRLVLHTTKPQYCLQDLTVYNLNLTGPAEPLFLSTTLQVTLNSRNPNDRVGIYYDKLDVYAVYKGQQITAPTRLPTQYQGQGDVSVWSSYMCGTDVQLAPYLTVALSQDQAAGYVPIEVRVHGLLRWKVSTWVSSHYHIDVNCPAFLTVGTGRGYQFKPVASCNVDVC